MPALFVFLFKVNIALLLFCAGYYLVLRHLTFYTLNRVYLMVAILFATLYPKIDLSDFAQRHETLAKPVQTVILNWQAPAESLIRPLTQPDYWAWATVIFWAGAIFLAFRLMMQLFSLFQLHRRSKSATIHEHDVRLIEGEAAPFSFWRSIYVNPANHTPADLKAILLHEQVHVNGWHTIDILLAELSSIFYWFNPGIWLMKKAVRENIEFITDRKILNKGFDSKTYQYSLVNVSFNANTTPGIVNHFNISTIKKRIIMMNAKRSSRFTLTRYAFVIPAVIALLLVFTLSKAEIAKPITHKIAVAMKPLTLAITQATQTTLAFADTTPVKKKAPFVTKADTIKIKQNFAFTYDTKPDTGRKQAFSISLDKSHSIDSMNLVLNGKKVDNTIFSKVDPGTITSINIMGQNDLNNLTGNKSIFNFDNKRNVIFVTTKDSEAGKAFAEKLNINRVDKIRLNGVTKDPKNLTLKEVETINLLGGVKGKVTNVRIVAHGNASTIPADEIKEIVLDSGIVRVSYPAKGVAGVEYMLRKAVDPVIIVQGKPTSFSATGTYTDASAVKEVVVTGYGTKNKVANITTDYPRTAMLRLRSMDRISDKLIVIDDKIASEKELKKLSAFDIDRMSTSNSTDTVKKYGDKAKYGVVYIYTKKGKQ
ncbi:bla regulator protein BlaR1 [Mucilaginibacter sp. UYNi724]